MEREHDMCKVTREVKVRARTGPHQCQGVYRITSPQCSVPITYSQLLSTKPTAHIYNEA